MRIWCRILLLFCIEHDYKLNYDNTRVSIFNPSAQICFANLRYLQFNLQTSLFIINHNHKIATWGAKSTSSLYTAASIPLQRVVWWNGNFSISIDLDERMMHTGIVSAHTAYSVCILKCACSQLHFYKYSEQRQSVLWVDHAILYLCLRAGLQVEWIKYLFCSNQTLWSSLY